VKTYAKGCWRISKLGLAMLPVLFAAAPLSAQSVSIMSPSSGAVVNPGQTVNVSVTVSGTFQQVFLIGERWLGFSQILSSAPYQFSVLHASNATIVTWSLSSLDRAG
jgi:hypothetical protein